MLSNWWGNRNSSDDMNLFIAMLFSAFFLYLEVKKSALLPERYGTRIYLDVFTVLSAIIGSKAPFPLRGN